MPHPHTISSLCAREEVRKIMKCLEDILCSFAVVVHACYIPAILCQSSSPLFAPFFLSSLIPSTRSFLLPPILLLWVATRFSVCVGCICEDEDLEDKSKGLLCVS